MGFFSGGFGTGLVEGLAEGATRSINVALDRREEELSTARKYLRERRSQKMEQAEKHDARAEKAMRRFVNMTGSNERALALYNWAGGDIDAVEQFLSDVDATKRADADFDLSATLDWTESNPDAVKNLSFDQVMDAVRFEYSDPSVEFEDTSGLANLGLGLDKARGQEFIGADKGKVGFKRKPIENLEVVTMDRSTLLPAIEWGYKKKQYDIATQQDAKDQFFNLQESIRNLDPNDPDYDTKKAELQADSNAILKSVARFEDAKEGSSGTAMSTNLYNTIYTQTVDDAIERAGIDTKNQTYTDANGNIAFAGTDAQGYNDALAAATRQGQLNFVRNQRRADGSFGANAMSIIEARGLSKLVKDLDAPKPEETEEATVDDTGAVDTTTPELSATDIEDAKTAHPTPQSMASATLASVPAGATVNTTALLNAMTSIYGISQAEAQKIIDDTMNPQSQSSEVDTEDDTFAQAMP
jgi:hypothetical protein